MEATEFQKFVETLNSPENTQNTLTDGKRNYVLAWWPQGYYTAIIGSLTVFFDNVEDLKDGWVKLRNGWHTAADLKVAELKVKA